MTPRKNGEGGGGGWGVEKDTETKELVTAAPENPKLLSWITALWTLCFCTIRLVDKSVCTALKACVIMRTPNAVKCCVIKASGFFIFAAHVMRDVTFKHQL